jgi:hypothetical protein
MRTLESLYWFGVRLHHQKEDFHIRKEDPYEMEAIDKQCRFTKGAALHGSIPTKSTGRSNRDLSLPGLYLQDV